MSSPLSLKQQIEQRMDELGVAAKRSLGQNFLINSHVVHKIIEAATQLNPKNLLEVGPGLGSLTTALHATGTPLKLIEMDSKFAAYWRRQGFAVFEGDALRLRWEDMRLSEDTVLVSNLPYQISSRLVIDRSTGPREIRAMVLMFQREVAERLTAQPRTEDYGFLTVVAQSYWSVSQVVDASPQDFYPAPKVYSRVLRLSRLSEGPDEEYVQFCKRAFTNRRKLFIKNFADQKPEVLAALSQLGLSEKVRAEEISVEQYLKMYSMLRQAKSGN